MEQGDDPYEILGLSSNTASAAEIKKAYRRLALKLHPDKNPNDAQAAALFAKVANAYEILSDDERRAQYDLHQRCGSKGFDSNACYDSPGCTTTSRTTPSSSKPFQQTYTTTSTNKPKQQTCKTTYTTTKTTSTSSSRSPQTSTTTRQTTSSSSSSEPITVTFSGSIPPEMAAQFRDPQELFKAMFAKEFGQDPDFLNDHNVRVVLETPPASPMRQKATPMTTKVKTPKTTTSTTKLSASPGKIPKSPTKMSSKSPATKRMPKVPNMMQMSSQPSSCCSDTTGPPQQQSMSSSTRQVRHGDGSIETITETTITWSDGRTETKRESSLQAPTARTTPIRNQTTAMRQQHRPTTRMMMTQVYQ